MHTEFFSLTFSREELQEIQEALAMRAIVEDEVRQEEGLESVDRRSLLATFDGLLHVSDARLAKMDERLEEELWRHAWYSYTDEWAWYRARMDTLKELGSSAAKTADAALEELTHRRYHEKFEDYIREIDMIHGGGDGRKTVPSIKGPS